MPVAKDQVTVVLPVLNEEEAIGKVIDELREKGYENILVVDGHSTDSTVEVARSRGVKVVMQHGVGKAGALKTAIDLVETPYMLVMDGDYTYDPKDIEKMLVYADRYDEVIGVRNARSLSKLHRLGNWIINFSFNLLFGTGLSDVCSGMYLLRTDAVGDLRIRSRGFDVEVELVAAMCANRRVTEVPINYRDRIGKSKLRTWKEGFSILSSVIGLARAYNPVFLLGTIASLLIVPGAIISVWQLLLRYLYGSAAWSIGMAWFGLLMLVAGLQGFTIATVALLLKRMERRISELARRHA